MKIKYILPWKKKVKRDIPLFSEKNLELHTSILDEVLEDNTKENMYIF